jgi:hypothetical protein
MTVNAIAARSERGAGWVINLVVAERLIRRSALRRDSASPSIPSAAAGVA